MLEGCKIQMKLKYYLRGLGIGIIVTMVIMSFIRQPEELTDTQIKARARELGMVEKSVLADLKKEEEDSFEKNAGEGQITEEESEKTENDDNVIQDNEEISDEGNLEAETKDEATTSIDETNSNIKETKEVVENYMIISIDGGNGSETVSRKLYNAGLVDSAVEYNQFLIENDYATRLRPGNHEIPVGATYDEMAKILCGIQ